MAKKKKMKRPPLRIHMTYSLVHEMLASPTEPLPKWKREHQLRAMWSGLNGLEKSAKPSTDDWRQCSDAVNLMETLVTHGDMPTIVGERVVASHWVLDKDVTVEVSDRSGLLLDAIQALAKAGERHQAGHNLRLDGPGMFAVRAVIEDYAELLDVLPARLMMRCHRLTEIRIRDALMGKPPRDVKVINL